MKQSRNIFDILTKAKNIIIVGILCGAAYASAAAILFLLAWYAIGWR